MPQKENNFSFTLCKLQHKSKKEMFSIVEKMRYTRSY